MSGNGNTVLYIPSNPKDAERIAGVIKEISNSMTRIEGEREYIKEAKKSLKEDWDLPPKVINLMVKLYHQQNADEYFEEQDEISTLYSTLFEQQNGGGV